MPTNAADRKKLYLQRKKSSLCPRCGIKVRKTSKYIYCDDCRGFFRDYNNEKSEDINYARKLRYEQRKEENRCPRCGVFVGKRAKGILCLTCLDKQYVYNNSKKRKKKPIKKTKTSRTR